MRKTPSRGPSSGTLATQARLQYVYFLGDTPRNFGWGCAALFTKSSFYLRTKTVIFLAPKSIPYVNPNLQLGCVHTWCPSTRAQARSQNGAVFRHWVPDILIPTSMPEYKVKTLYSGTGTVPEFWRGDLKNRCVHISAHQKYFSGTVPGHQV